MSKYSPSSFLKYILKGEKRTGHLKIIDSKYKQSIVDTEVSGYLYVPKEIELEGNNLVNVSETKNASYHNTNIYVKQLFKIKREMELDVGGRKLRQTLI